MALLKQVRHWRVGVEVSKLSLPHGYGSRCQLPAPVPVPCPSPAMLPAIMVVDSNPLKW